MNLQLRHGGGSARVWEHRVRKRLGALAWPQSLQDIFQNLITREMSHFVVEMAGVCRCPGVQPALRTPFPVAQLIGGPCSHTSVSVLCRDAWRLLVASRGLSSGSALTEWPWGRGCRMNRWHLHRVRPLRRAGLCIMPSGSAGHQHRDWTPRGVLGHLSHQHGRRAGPGLGSQDFPSLRAAALVLEWGAQTTAQPPPG